mmetsp:Transcript_7219/g.18849  ORF Transcript_7219/g.18849 Transcript_7219/m.18849 type:complete len:85 (+) Transcript_7219:1486-1740(+)
MAVVALPSSEVHLAALWLSSCVWPRVPWKTKLHGKDPAADQGVKIKDIWMSSAGGPPGASGLLVARSFIVVNIMTKVNDSRALQ